MAAHRSLIHEAVEQVVVGCRDEPPSAASVSDSKLAGIDCVAVLRALDAYAAAARCLRKFLFNANAALTKAVLERAAEMRRDAADTNADADKTWAFFETYCAGVAAVMSVVFDDTVAPHLRERHRSTTPAALLCSPKCEAWARLAGARFPRADQKPPIRPAVAQAMLLRALSG
jgi:hypothetical protein